MFCCLINGVRTDYQSNKPQALTQAGCLSLLSYAATYAFRIIGSAIGPGFPYLRTGDSRVATDAKFPAENDGIPVLDETCTTGGGIVPIALGGGSASSAGRCPARLMVTVAIPPPTAAPAAKIAACMIPEDMVDAL